MPDLAVIFLHFLHRNWKVPCSNIEPKTGYHCGRFSWFCSVCTRKFLAASTFSSAFQISICIC